MPQVRYIKSSNEPDGGWLGPSGPGQWPDLQELDQRQREQLRRKR